MCVQLWWGQHPSGTERVRERDRERSHVCVHVGENDGRRSRSQHGRKIRREGGRSHGSRRLTPCCLPACAWCGGGDSGKVIQTVVMQCPVNFTPILDDEVRWRAARLLGHRRRREGRHTCGAVTARRGHLAVCMAAEALRLCGGEQGLV